MLVQNITIWYAHAIIHLFTSKWSFLWHEKYCMSNVVQTELQAINMVEAKEESWTLEKNLLSHSLSSQKEILWIEAAMWKNNYFQPLSEIKKEVGKCKMTHQLSASQARRSLTFLLIFSYSILRMKYPLFYYVPCFLHKFQEQ